MITATTVGYGDVQIAESKDAKLFACLHIVVSVSWIASLISWIDNLSSKRSSQLQRANLILNPPKREQIMALDHDNKGVDELEFVVGMLMNLGVQLCGQKLTWDDVRQTLLSLGKWSAENGYLYTVANDITMDDAWIEAARAQLYGAYEAAGFAD